LSSATAAWFVQGDDKGGGGGGGAGFLSILSMSLGPPGEAITTSLFWFLLTAIIVAYTSEGGMLISQSAKGFASAKIDPAIGSLLFAASFASLAVYGTSGVDAVNRVFVFGLVVAFVGLVGFGLPNVEVSNSMNSADWGIIYPRVISIGILSLGAQNVVPALLQYLDYDPLKTRRTILFGSSLPLILYMKWPAPPTPLSSSLSSSSRLLVNIVNVNVRLRCSPTRRLPTTATAFSPRSSSSPVLREGRARQQAQ
jgi:hypothetical protein